MMDMASPPDKPLPHSSSQLGRGHHHGRDQALRTVPPGVYVYRLIVDTDNKETQQQIGTVSVAY